MNSLLSLWRRFVVNCQKQRILETKETLAYWTARADTWRQLCTEEHMSYERDKLAEAYANQKKYEARLTAYTEK